MMTIVFDFDKTLTYTDSLTQFFKERMRGWRAIWWPYYMCLKVLSKFGAISVLREKELAMNALCPRSYGKMEELFSDFASHIKLSEIDERVNSAIAAGHRVVVLSASLEIYLRKIYPQCLVIGMQFAVGTRFHVTQHPYGKAKIECLKSYGIGHVDEFYYDSESDEEVFPICDRAYKVSNGRIVNEKILKL